MPRFLQPTPTSPPPPPPATSRPPPCPSHRCLFLHPRRHRSARACPGRARLPALLPWGAARERLPAPLRRFASPFSVACSLAGGGRQTAAPPTPSLRVLKGWAPLPCQNLRRLLWEPCSTGRRLEASQSWLCRAHVIRGGGGRSWVQAPLPHAHLRPALLTQPTIMADGAPPA